MNVKSSKIAVFMQKINFLFWLLFWLLLLLIYKKFTTVFFTKYILFKFFEAVHHGKTNVNPTSFIILTISKTDLLWKKFDLHSQLENNSWKDIEST